MNYDLKMEEEIKNITPGTKLLLHACCAPCSSAVLERLGNIFEITILYYNPNITDDNEYNKRLNEVKSFIKKFKTKYKISIIDGKYDINDFLEISKGLEKEVERGKRCYKCYNLRLEETAKVAEQLNLPYFTTTLSLSPYKNSNWINEIGEDLNNKYNSTYLYSDFKKKNGYKRSIELSKEYNLYRQNYCGCIYSKKEGI
ncbi:MAG: epoxyqueuosine reductase QueH [Bacilli bacterium]|nr:epoxyqueuosine reductase QueH [Bacilli bacterium]